MQQIEIEQENRTNITLTIEAQQHFKQLLTTEFPDEDVNLRLTVTDAGTSKADVGITFCPIGLEQAADIDLNYPGFILYIENTAVPALKDAVIDFKKNEFGGELFVKAPYIKGGAPSKDAPLEQRIQYILDNEINPNLANHGGSVSLVAIESGAVVILKFGGGCHGCGMADVTLKNGIETTLKQQCPEITAIKDVTDHDSGENPYYIRK